LLHFTFLLDPFLLLLNFGVGMAFGLSLCSRLIGWLLKRYQEITVASLAGVMLGALKVLWPFWSYTYESQEAGQFLHPLKPLLYPVSTFQGALVLALFIGSIAAVLLLERMMGRLKKTPAPESVHELGP